MMQILFSHDVKHLPVGRVVSNSDGCMRHIIFYLHRNSPVDIYRMSKSYFPPRQSCDIDINQIIEQTFDNEAARDRAFYFATRYLNLKG
jgi:hypothetical protein